MRGRWYSLLALLLAGLLQIAAPAVARNDAPAPIAEISVTVLPADARATLVLIRKGGPYRYSRDGAVFGNYEHLLPPRARGYYREYTVPTPGEKNRGARRIVAGVPGEYYYTDDHYRSFRRIRE